MAGREITEARQLIRAARGQVDPRSKWAGELAACEQRLDEPLRVALTGTLKSGKSTLLNALIGDEIAPTDATECTRVVTWFQQSAAPRIDLVTRGQHRRIPVLRTDGRLTMDLGVAADAVERLTVSWPSALLDDYTLIDTPGTSSNSRDVSERTLALLAPEEGPCEADAVLYLMRDLRDADVQLLQSIHHRMTLGAGPLGVLGVLSRADEIAGGHGDSLADAHRLSATLAEAPELRGLHQSFLPVSGLLALRGQTLRQHEFQALRALASIPQHGLEAALVSVARFAAPETPLPVLAADRRRLAEAFGLFGIRLSVALIRSGCPDAPALSAELIRRGGLGELRRTLEIRFGERNEQLRAHSALARLAHILARYRTAGTAELAGRVSRCLADTHTFTELRLLSTIRSNRLSEPDRARAARVLGGEGIAAHRRLGLAPDASPAKCRGVALQAIRHWRNQLENPLLDPRTAATCRAAARSCEAIVAANN
ncbi:dynamin family protein [Nocardia sp. NPDC004123]